MPISGFGFGGRSNDPPRGLIPIRAPQSQPWTVALPAFDIRCDGAILIRAYRRRPPGCDGGIFSPPLGGAAKFWPQNADFEPREAPNNVNNSKRLQH